MRIRLPFWELEKSGKRPRETMMRWAIGASRFMVGLGGAGFDSTSRAVEHDACREAFTYARALQPRKLVMAGLARGPRSRGVVVGCPVDRGEEARARYRERVKAPSCWLVKSEPYKYPFASLVRDSVTSWDGVRNYEARNNLRAMKRDQLVLFYHSNEGKAVVGVARVVREAYPDPTSDEDWSAVDLAPVSALVLPVTLAAIKATPALADMALVRKSRISVVPVTRPELVRILAMGKTKLRG